ncbi:hypothetical protein SMI01S_16560 [Sphingobacterium mizutaii NBRC 14946 = DSM 11724]|uniref:Uncharacterized protein n=2 Tax=Sphingobacterium mizutaii TaxID=1010 RepID=A0AAJ4X8I6_9SPHI|nr:hypothetical protein [Sphingobacterium mizutaii]GEM68050.1 hypothetical protein SMI01S_16560 [Sphingobacterium mizutaii NBRC 14946 = DSM 11724]SDL77577.1 hypothetical protein SAMN05192578_10925 [Sphingobacterium mizutaii]SNV38142.1 Uncharacterised protein [Sphingobacterium mizutaii]
MKKSIKVLIEKLDENEKGEFTGGFGSIKGGFRQLSASLFSSNPGCTNPGDCRGSTNPMCTNTGTC